MTYETRFDGSEPYLRDHQVRGGRVLPGVAQLEMARVAVARALGREDTAAVRLTDVVWLRAAVYGPEGLTLRVRVRTGGAGCTYEVLAVGADGDTALCGQGRASLAEDAAGRRTLSLAELRAACTEATYSRRARLRPLRRPRPGVRPLAAVPHRTAHRQGARRAAGRSSPSCACRRQPNRCTAA
ncbi:polyketide synthase dehydratase domain-containing protein [Streptomyces thinghirensis]|nr:polyketide synthase dehydratase domain-containing protein [Streptomyces thinghirensis]